MGGKNDVGVRELKNGFWAYRFCISVGGKKIQQRGSTDQDGNVLRTKADAIKARKQAIKLAQLAPMQTPAEEETEKKTVREVLVTCQTKCNFASLNATKEIRRRGNDIKTRFSFADHDTFLYQSGPHLSRTSSLRSCFASLINKASSDFW